MKTRALVVRAENDPQPGVLAPGPHQTYRNPRISVEERTLGPLRSDEIRVEMLLAGVCGTDVHLVETNPETGYIKCSAPAVIPPEGRVIGHEGVGRVLEVGSGVQNTRPGALVTFESVIVCHHCDVCRRGRFNQCRRAMLLGLEKDGLFSEIADVPALLAHDVSELGRSPEGLQAAALVEPAGVAYVACENARVTPGDEVIVFGGGPIGQFAGLFSRLLFGAAHVELVEPLELRRNLASAWVDRVLSPEEFQQNPPEGVDVVIEASGRIDNVEAVFRKIKPNGRVVFLARSGAPLSLTGVDHMITNEISLVGSRGHLCGAFTRILSLYDKGRLPLRNIVTRTAQGLDELADLLRTPESILNNNCKVLVSFK